MVGGNLCPCSCLRFIQLAGYLVLVPIIDSLRAEPTFLLISQSFYFTSRRHSSSFNGRFTSPYAIFLLALVVNLSHLAPTSSSLRRQHPPHSGNWVLTPISPPSDWSNTLSRTNIRPRSGDRVTSPRGDRAASFDAIFSHLAPIPSSFWRLNYHPFPTLLPLLAVTLLHHGPN